MSLRKLFKKLPHPLQQKIRQYCEKTFFEKNRVEKRPHRLYGDIYAPLYNYDAPMSAAEPDFYNEDGRRKEIFFLRDIHFAHSSYVRGARFEFDRYNWGLKTHFYSHQAMLETMGRPDRRYGFLNESEAIVPEDYALFRKNPGLEKDFDLIFTFSAELLDSLPNARHVPFGAGLWVGPAYGDDIREDAWARKSKNISILSSDKTMCAQHHLRLELARKCRREGLADAFGRFDGGQFVEKLSEVLLDYRYSIILENDLRPFYFTERLTSCFATMTVPIYLGASEIDRFFNPDGIIKISVKDLDDIEKVLAQCSERDYEERLKAIEDNYRRSRRYVNVYDLMYDDYLAPEAGGGK